MSLSPREQRLLEYAVGLAALVAAGFVPGRVKLYSLGAVAAVIAGWLVRDNIRLRREQRLHLQQIEARKWAHRRGERAAPQQPPT